MIKKIKNWFNTGEKIKEDLYIRILLWAHKRQESGFTIEEIGPTFSLSQEEDMWVRKIFLTTSDNDRKFFEHLRNDDSVEPNKHIYSLNEKGLSFATNYLALKQSEKSSRVAQNFASISLIIASVGLIYQVRQTSLAELQGIGARVEQARSIQGAREFCRGNPEAADSGLFEISTGKSASCVQIIRQYENQKSFFERVTEYEFF